MKNIFYRLAVLMLALVMATFGACTETPETPDNNDTDFPGNVDDNTETPDGGNEPDETPDDTTEPEAVKATVGEIAKHGNLKLDLLGSTLFEQGYEYGDVLNVTVAGKTYALPLCSNYSDVDTGMAVVRAVSADEIVVIAYNMGDFATTEGIATKVTVDEDPGYRWDLFVESPIEVEFTMNQKGGYRDQWLIRQLFGTVNREDYPHLSDAEFANFRAINTTGMGKNVLYRSSSPLNPEYGRNTYANNAMEEAGILTVINLADPYDVYGNPEDIYYLSCQVDYINIGIDFLSENTKESLAGGIRFIINNDGPYLIHCNEGKDRAGFVSALLECLMGATLEEVIDDYMLTYYNYFGVEKGTEKYDAILENNLIKTLNTNFEIDDVYTADLAAEAEAYLTEGLGLSADEVAALKAKLGA